MAIESKNLEFSLSAKEICSIIKTCKEAGVQSFELGALHFNLAPEVVKEITTSNTWDQPPSYNSSVQPQSDTQSTTQNNSQDNEAPDLEDDLLPILDPTRWEENLMKAD
jgi:hypothetical protein